MNLFGLGSFADDGALLFLIENVLHFIELIFKPKMKRFYFGKGLLGRIGRCFRIARWDEVGLLGGQGVPVGILGRKDNFKKFLTMVFVVLPPRVVVEKRVAWLREGEP